MASTRSAPEPVLKLKIKLNVHPCGQRYNRPNPETGAEDPVAAEGRLIHAVAVDALRRDPVAAAELADLEMQIVAQRAKPPASRPAATNRPAAQHAQHGAGRVTGHAAPGAGTAASGTGVRPLAAFPGTSSASSSSSSSSLAGGGRVVGVPPPAAAPAEPAASLKPAPVASAPPPTLLELAPNDDADSSSGEEEVIGSSQASGGSWS